MDFPILGSLGGGGGEGCNNLALYRGVDTMFIVEGLDDNCMRSAQEKLYSIVSRALNFALNLIYFLDMQVHFKQNLIKA